MKPLNSLEKEVVNFAEQKIILSNAEPDINAGSAEIAEVIVRRLGLMPRKKGSTEKMNRVLLELYERAKVSSREKNPTKSIMTVEDMAYFAGITRQTMYDYLKRWLELDLIQKTSFIDENHKVVIGYRLSGPTLEAAFDKARTKIANNLDYTARYIKELQRVVKNEKISGSQREKPEKD